MPNGESGQGKAHSENPYAAPDAAASSAPGTADEVPSELSGGADIGEVFGAFGKLFEESAKSGVLWVLIAFQAAMSVTSQIPALMIQGKRPEQLGGADFGMIAVGYLLVFFISALGITLYRPLRNDYFAGGGQSPSIGEAVSDALSRYGAALIYILAYTGITVLGMIACLIPGIVAAIGLAPGYYLVVASDELGVGDAISEAWGLFTRHWGSIIAAGLVYVLGMILVITPVYAVMFATESMQSVPGRIAINFLIGVPGFVFYTALFARVEVKDRTEGTGRAIWRRVDVPGGADQQSTGEPDAPQQW